MKKKIRIWKSIVAKRTILKGEKFSNKNLTTKRPGFGISAAKWENFRKKQKKIIQRSKYLMKNIRIIIRMDIKGPN